MAGDASPGAPLFPDGSRKRYDPRAPGTSNPPKPPPSPPVMVGAEGPDGPSAGLCDGMQMTENPVRISGTGVPGALVKVYMASAPLSGTMVGSVFVDPAGAWAFSLPHLPDGERCVTATQSVSGGADSVHSSPICFIVGECPSGPPTGPSIDMDAHAVRFSPDRGWEHGTLAYQTSAGTWTYGVLRKVGA